MKIDAQKVRGAMNSRLSFLDADTGRRARIRARIRKEEEPEMKRKVSAGMALTALIIMLTAGIALAAGLNLFDYFSNEDVRFADMASQAELSATETVMVHSKALGATAASITNAYYDGSSLLVAYSIENGTRREPFVPTAQQLAEMTRMEKPMPVMIENGADPLARQYNDALKSGTPFGYITYAVTPSDHTLTDAGDDLGPATETGGEQENGAVYVIREYDTAPPEAEYINLEIPLWQSIQYLYFDGTNSYTLAAIEAAAAMTATVWRTDVTRLHLTGSGWYLDSAVTAEADVSANHAELVFKVDGDGFIPPDAESWRGVALSDTLDSSDLYLEGEIWYDAILNDANGNRLAIESFELTDPHTITASFQGTGGLTGNMTAILLICSEEAGTNVTSAITLRVEPGTAGTAAYIMNTHYDDEALSVAYTIQNRTWRETFTPTEEQLAEMIRLEDGTLPLPELKNPLALRYSDAVQSGTPFGLITYTVFGDDRVLAGTVPGTEIDLGPADKTRSEETDTAQTVIREYATPQIAGEYLNLEIPLWTNIVYRYFDGTDSYGMNAACETAGAIKTTVWREKPETLYMAGTGWYLDAAVSAAAEVSAESAKILLRADGDGFLNPDAESWREMMARKTDGGDVPDAEGEVWYDVVVVDENGNHLPTESCTLQDAYMISALLKGTGGLPESLTVTLQMCTDGAAVQAAQPIVLRPEIVEFVNPYTAPADSGKAEDDTAYVSSWAELNAAALAGKTNVVVTANIFFGETDETVVFHNAVTLQAEGMHYNIDGGGRQILCVQGPDADTPLTEETVIRNLVFLNGRSDTESKDVYQAGYGGAVFVQGPLRMESCALQFNGSTRGALCVADGDATLTDCWLTNNTATEGAGLYMLNGNATLTDCKITENHARKGGGIYGENADITVFNSRISENPGEEMGGGIYLSRGNLSLSGCTMDGNITEGYGGAIFMEIGTLTLDERTVLSNNRAQVGGGMYVNTVDIALVDGDILDNTADDGGGICLENSSITVFNGLIKGNTGDPGAGIYASGAEVALKGGTITENTAAETGGGIYLESSTLTEVMGDVVDNTPDNIAYR